MCNRKTLSLEITDPLFEVDDHEFSFFIKNHMHHKVMHAAKTARIILLHSYYYEKSMSNRQFPITMHLLKRKFPPIFFKSSERRQLLKCTSSKNRIINAKD